MSKSSLPLIALLRWSVDFFDVLYWFAAVVCRLGSPNPPCFTLRLLRLRVVSLTCFCSRASSKGPVMILSRSVQSAGSTCVACRSFSYPTKNY